MQVRNTTDPSVKPALGERMRHLFSIFFPAETFAMAGRAIGVFALVIATVFGGGLVSAQVYRDAAPGEMLYRVKVAVEKAQLFLAPNDDYRTRLHTELADRRIDEVAKLAEGPADGHELVPGVLAAFETEVLALQDGLEKLRATDPNAVEVAKLLERKMAVYQNMLRKAGNLLPPALDPSVARSRDLVDGLTIRAMAVIVEKHLAGSSDAPRAVVEAKFEERLRQAESKLTTASEDPAKQVATTKAKAAIAEAKELIREEKYQAALTKIAEVAELTKEVEAQEAVTPPPAETTEGGDSSQKEEGAVTPPAEEAPAAPPKE